MFLPMPKFVVTKPGGGETSFYEDDDDIFIGRVSAINDICINDASVSRQHAHLKRREEGYTIYDLKSTNGLFLNGTRVSRALLKDGDVIQVGEVRITVFFRVPSQDEELSAIEQSEQTEVSTLREKEVTQRTVVEPISAGRRKKRKKIRPRKP